MKHDRLLFFPRAADGQTQGSGQARVDGQTQGDRVDEKMEQLLPLLQPRGCQHEVFRFNAKAVRPKQLEDTRRLRRAFSPVDVLQVEPIGQVEVRLHGGALPRPPNSIADFQVNLRSVKSPPAFVYLEKTKHSRQRHERPGGLRPHRTQA